MDWSNPAAVAGIVTAISAASAAIISIINTWYSVKINRKANDAVVASDAAKNVASEAKDQITKNQEQIQQMHEETREVSKKTDQTLHNTNGNLEQLRDQLQRMEERNANQQEMINQLTTILSAQRAAGGPTGGVSIGSRVTDAPLKVTVVEADPNERRDKDKK